jgi:hypothetical protein
MVNDALPIKFNSFLIPMFFSWTWPEAPIPRFSSLQTGAPDRGNRTFMDI